MTGEPPVPSGSLHVPPEYTDRFAYTDQIAVPFYAALGRAFARWQDVESGLFLVTHAALGASAQVSSVVFFHVKSQSAKAQLCDKLWQIGLEGDLAAEWAALVKRIAGALTVRNQYAHFETAWLKPGNGHYPEIDPPIILVPHHMDVVAWGRKQHTYFDTQEIDATTLEWQKLTQDLLRHVLRRYSLEQLRTESLPPVLVQMLESTQCGLQPHELQRKEPTQEQERTP